MLCIHRLYFATMRNVTMNTSLITFTGNLYMHTSKSIFIVEICFKKNYCAVIIIFINICLYFVIYFFI